MNKVDKMNGMIELKDEINEVEDGVEDKWVRDK